MNPHQRCLQAKVKYRNEPKQVMPKSEDLSRSLEINAIRASSAYSDFLVRSRLLTGKLLGQGYNRFKLITTFKKFYGRHYDLIGKFQHSVIHMVTDLFLETLFLR